MSLTGAASPKIGLSPSFGSNLGRLGAERKSAGVGHHHHPRHHHQHRHHRQYLHQYHPDHHDGHHKRSYTDGDVADTCTPTGISDVETTFDTMMLSENTPLLLPSSSSSSSSYEEYDGDDEDDYDEEEAARHDNHFKHHQHHHGGTSSEQKSGKKKKKKKNPSSLPSKKIDDTNKINFTLLLTVVVVTIGSSLQFGYGTGVMNNSEQIILNYFHSQNKVYDETIQWAMVVSCFGLGGLVGSVIGPKVFGIYCGRKTTLLLNNIFLIISSIFIIYASEWYYQAIGRVFVGIVAGIVTSVVPTYFSEISPIEIRGAIGTCHQLGITIGILLSQTLSTPSLQIFGTEEKWQYLFVVPVVCGVLELLILPFCPESPSYLYLTKGKYAAQQSLIRLLSSKRKAKEYLGYIEEEIQQSQQLSENGSGSSGGASNDDKNNGIEETASSSSSSSSSNSSMDVATLLQDKSLRKQLIVGITVQLMMQFSGIDAVFYYSTRVFYQANVSNPELATTCLGVINVLITIIAVKYMDVAGRKTLLIYSWIGMCASYVVLTLSFVLKKVCNAPDDVSGDGGGGASASALCMFESNMDQVSILSMTGVIIFFAFGPGCIAWFIIAEIFPLKARDTAMAIGIFLNWVANWFVAFIFPMLLEWTQPYTFLVFVSTTGFFLFFTINFVPETKGLTVKQVSEEFEKITFNFLGE